METTYRRNIPILKRSINNCRRLNVLSTNIMMVIVVVYILKILYFIKNNWNESRIDIKLYTIFSEISFIISIPTILRSYE